MKSFLVGMIAGALAAAGVTMLDTRRLSLLALVVALVAGLLAGLLVGWREPKPRAALITGMASSSIAGVLFLLASLAGGAAASQRGSALALVGVILCVIVGGAFAGILSAWTGYPHSAKPLPLPRPPTTSGPLGPLPTPG